MNSCIVRPCKSRWWGQYGEPLGLPSPLCTRSINHLTYQNRHQTSHIYNAFNLSMPSVCSASMQWGQYDTSKVGNICLPLNLMGYGCPVPQGAVVLLCLLGVAQQVSGRTRISMYISHSLCQGFCQSQFFQLLQSAACMQTRACLVTIPRIVCSALAKENWNGLCMTPMQNHRLAGGAGKDATRQAKTFWPLSDFSF